jgi:hypothetical protein
MSKKVINQKGKLSTGSNCFLKNMLTCGSKLLTLQPK